MRFLAGLLEMGVKILLWAFVLLIVLIIVAAIVGKSAGGEIAGTQTAPAAGQPQTGTEPENTLRPGNTASRPSEEGKETAPASWLDVDMSEIFSDEFVIRDDALYFESLEDPSVFMVELREACTRVGDDDPLFFVVVEDGDIAFWCFLYTKEQGAESRFPIDSDLVLELDRLFREYF